MEIKDKDGNVLYSLNFAHYGESREINATEGEQAIADHILSLCPTSKVVRLSNDYITIKCIDTDICRFKFTDKARWLVFPYLKDKGKRRFDDLDELTSFDDAIIESYKFACKMDKVD